MDTKAGYKFWLKSKKITKKSQFWHSIFTLSRSPDYAWRPQIWPVSLSQKGTIMSEINRARPKSNQLWRWSGYITMQNFSIRSINSLGNAKKPKILPISLSQSATKGGKSTDHDQNLISSEGVQDTSGCKILGYCLHAFSGKCPETPNSTQFTKSKWHQKEQNRKQWPKSNQFWRWSGYISRQNFRLFPSCVLREIPENRKFDPFH